MANGLFEEYAKALARPSGAYRGAKAAMEGFGDVAEGVGEIQKTKRLNTPLSEIFGMEVLQGTGLENARLRDIQKDSPKGTAMEAIQDRRRLRDIFGDSPELDGLGNLNVGEASKIAPFLQSLKTKEKKVPESLDAILAERVRSGQMTMEQAATIKRSFSPAGVPAKPPTGYRYKANGDLEAIPGGPASKGPGSEKSVQDAYNLYKKAKQGLSSSLDKTSTGPIIGRLPAFTSEQQAADSSVAAMAPVLKQLFRVAGEGVFTDRDQELLLRMVTNRTIRSEARKEILQNVDNIVRAKLGIADDDGGDIPDESSGQEENQNSDSLYATATNTQGVTIETRDGGKTWRPVQRGN